MGCVADCGGWGFLLGLSNFRKRRILGLSPMAEVWDPFLGCVTSVFGDLWNWRMGLRSVYPEFRNVRYLGIYNPRLNVASRIEVSQIPDDVIDTVEKDVIGYTE